MLALSQGQVETIIAQGRRALEYLDLENLPTRTFTNATLGYAYQIKGDRAGARSAYTEARSISQESGNTAADIVASIGLGAMQEADNELHLALETYQHVLFTAADLPFPVISEAHLGLARIHYQWNDLEAAGRAWQQSALLARQLENTDRPVACQVFRARLKLAQGDVAGAAAIVAEADQSVRLHNFMLQVPEVAAVHVLVLLRQGDLAAAAHLAGAHQLQRSQARVYLAQGDPAAALAVLEPYRRQMAEKAWADEELKALVLLAVALDAHGDRAKAAQLLDEALALAEPDGFIRLFVDEGAPMTRLLYEACSRGVHAAYVRQVLAAFPATEPGQAAPLRAATAGSPPGRTAQCARARGAPPHRRRADQPGDRNKALPVPAHGEGARPQHLRKARREQSHAGRRQGTSPGTPVPGPPRPLTI